MESHTYSEIAASKAELHAVLISRHGKLCFEHYRKREDAHELHQLYSITKSIVALGMGLLVREKGEAILHQSILEWCPEIHIDQPDPRRVQLTLHHLLSQTAGFQWRELACKWGTGNPLYEMEHHHDWISFVLNRDFASAPGRHFNYSSGVSHLIPFLMGRILQRDPSEMLLEELLFPLGIDHLLWEADPQGNPAGGKGLHLRAKDVLQIGHLVLGKGELHGKRLLDASWIEQCLTKKVHVTGMQKDYGYQWWLHGQGVVAATGFGGQYLLIDPSLGLVAVFLGNLGKSDMEKPVCWFEALRKDCIDESTNLV